MLTPRRLLITDGSPAALAALTLQDRPDQTVLWAAPSLAPPALGVVQRQAAHFGVDHLVGPGLDAGRTPPPSGPRAIGEGRLLLDALLASSQWRCGRIIWPCQGGRDLDRIAEVQEIVACISHIARLDTAWRAVGPEIRTPLLDCTDEQIMDLIGASGVGLSLSWWCEGQGTSPCGGCGPCRRWQAVSRLAAA